MIRGGYARACVCVLPDKCVFGTPRACYCRVSLAHVAPNETVINDNVSH